MTMKTFTESKETVAPKIVTALNLLKKNRWVNRTVLVDALNTEDLRAVRHLRRFGYEIQVRKGKNGYEYKRLS